MMDDLVTEARRLLDDEGRWAPSNLAAFAPRLLAALADRCEELEHERDLAVAHDRQPYPTAEAYEKACAALWKHRAAVAELTAEHDATVAMLDWAEVPVIVDGETLTTPERVRWLQHYGRGAVIRKRELEAGIRAHLPLCLDDPDPSDGLPGDLRALLNGDTDTEPTCDGRCTTPEYLRALLEGGDEVPRG